MKVVYQDLINLLSEKPSKDFLSKKLFQLGHEHEIHDDIFDMDLTPNRGDCLSLIGLARDLNPFFGKSHTLDVYEDKIEPLKLDFENLSPLACPKISFLEIEIEQKETTYKPYLESYFNTIGNKKTNLFTDISNYISYELGQPTHCYEREAINSNLIFEDKECNVTFKTLLNTEIELKDKNCIFSMGGEVLSLAGVMGGISSACSSKTKKVLVECAYLTPESIIGKSIKYNLNSDAAHKFERGVDINSQEIALMRFAKIVQDHATIKSIKLKSFESGNFQNILIPIDIKKINKILGTKLEEPEYLDYLKKLNFDISNNIKVPSFRHDIKTNNDLAEEIARVIGYNNIKSSPINLKKIANDKNESKIAKLETFFTNNGFSEVINFPFTSTKKSISISIDNPLDSNRNNLRVNLKDSLVSNLLYNERRQKDSIKLFEISDIYTKDIAIKQKRKIGIIVSGRLGNNYNDFTKKLDSKYLNNILSSDNEENIFEIIEIPRNTLDTKSRNKIFYVEIPIEDIPNSFFLNLEVDKKSITFSSYEPISEYPSSTRDFSFLVDDLTKVNEVINMLDKVSDKIIKKIFIFDFYKNEKSGFVKLGYRFIFQSYHTTLLDLEINNKVQEIISPIIEMDGVSIPGM